MHCICLAIVNSSLLRQHATYRHYDDRLRSKDARFDIPVRIIKHRNLQLRTIVMPVEYLDSYFEKHV